MSMDDTAAPSPPLHHWDDPDGSSWALGWDPRRASFHATKLTYDDAGNELIVDEVGLAGDRITTTTQLAGQMYRSLPDQLTRDLESDAAEFPARALWAGEQMRVIDARFGDPHPADGSPRLELLVDRILAPDELRYEKIPTEDGQLYVAEQDGYVHVFHQPASEAGRGLGFDGATFHIPLDDGTTATVVGPYATNPAAVTRHRPDLDLRPVSMTDDATAFYGAYSPVAVCVTGR